MKKPGLFNMIFGLALIFGCTSSVPVESLNKNLTIAQDGKSDYVIVTAVDPSPSEKLAASELQKFIKEISGAELTIITDAEKLQSKEIILGQNKHLAKIGVRIDFLVLGAEGFIIKTSGNYLIIAGGALRGTMYGVYSFLEDYLNCRWFTPKASRIPQSPVISIPPLDAVQKPALEYREINHQDAFDTVWAVRNKLNGCHVRLDESCGGRVDYYPFVHSFYTLVPPEKYFADHPEYYSERDGKRFYERGQLCLTNPDVLRIVIERVKEIIKEKPEVDIISVSQNDCTGWCECANCRALDEQEDSHSGTLLNFVNKVALAIEKDHPDKAIDTLAYMYTRKPPRTIVPRPNVIVRLCSIECCFLQPLEVCPEDVSFVCDIRGWSKICPRLYIWDYVINFAHYFMPNPNFYSLGPNIRFFARHNVKGIFEQGNGTEFSELRNYVLAKLLWNPDYDEGKAISEFIKDYYGKAATAIRGYFDLLHDRSRQLDIHLGIFDPPNLDFLNPETISQCAAYFDEAEKLAENTEILRRVRISRLPVMFMQIVTAPDNKPDQQLLEEFFRITNDAGITMLGEVGSTTLEAFRKELANPRPFIGIRMSNSQPKDNQGVEVADVVSGKPAESAGIQKGDIITAINQQSVTDIMGLTEIIRNHKVGDSIILKINRAGIMLEFTLTLAPAPLY